MALNEKSNTQGNYSVTNNLSTTILPMISTGSTPLPFQSNMQILESIAPGKTGKITLPNAISVNYTTFVSLASPQVIQPIGLYSLNPQQTASINITTQDQKVAQTAIQLYADVLANTDKVLTKGVNSAIQASGNQLTQYFQALPQHYPQYKGVDPITYLTVWAYCQNLPFLWTNYTSTVTYYLYSNDGNQASYGSVTLTCNNFNKSASTLTTANNSYSGICSAVYTDTNNRKINLTYSGGGFVSSDNSVQLMGMLYPSSKISGMGNFATFGNYALMLMGKLSNTQVVGVTSQAPAQSSSSSQSSGSSFPPAELMQWIGILMAGEWALGKISEVGKAAWEGLKSTVNKGSDETSENTESGSSSESDESKAAKASTNNDAEGAQGESSLLDQVDSGVNKQIKATSSRSSDTSLKSVKIGNDATTSEKSSGGNDSDNTQSDNDFDGEF